MKEEGISLYYQQGGSDKVYHLQLETIDGKWSVGIGREHPQQGRPLSASRAESEWAFRNRLRSGPGCRSFRSHRCPKRRGSARNTDHREHPKGRCASV